MSLSLAGNGTVVGFDPVASGFGGLVAVKSALFTGTQSASVSAGGSVAVTDLSITHAMSNASNKLIINAYLGAVADATFNLGRVGLAVADDGTLIGVGAAEGGRTRVGAGGRNTDGNAAAVAFPAVAFVHEPGDTASHTYTVRAVNIHSATDTLFINRSEDDSASANSSRASSGFVIQEVSV